MDKVAPAMTCLAAPGHTKTPRQRIAIVLHMFHACHRQLFSTCINSKQPFLILFLFFTVCRDLRKVTYFLLKCEDIAHQIANI